VYSIIVMENSVLLPVPLIIFLDDQFPFGNIKSPVIGAAVH
jgi:hypothetical protein